MSTHLEESLRRDFDRVRALITTMSGSAVRMLRDCIGAFVQRDRQRAALIILRDQQIDQFQKQIDHLCLEFLVRHQPVGSHLRFAYAAPLINFELERIGDYAESIARQIIKLIDLNCDVPTGIFTEISAVSIAMLEKAVTAFVRQDADLAQMTAQIEEQVDVLRNQANSELLHLVQTNQIPLAALTPLMTIARRFERVSDQAKSICQETIYSCTGEYAKHTGAHVYRVLFVDDHHGYLSRMAEGIGRTLAHAEFEFVSAGVEPQPLAPEVLSLLRERGFANSAPQGVRDLPDFAQYQLVIALSPAAKKQLPQPSRKSVQLEWTPPFSAKPAGSPQEFQKLCQEASTFLSTEIARIIQTLEGEEKPKQAL